MKRHEQLRGSRSTGSSRQSNHVHQRGDSLFHAPEISYSSAIHNSVLTVLACESFILNHARRASQTLRQ